MDGSGYTDCIGFVDWKGGVNASFLVIYQHGTNHGLCFYNVTDYRQMGKSPLQLSITSKILDKTMNYLKLVVSNFIKQEDGPTAVEYAIMLALIVVVCIAAVSSIGQSARGVFEAVANVF